MSSVREVLEALNPAERGEDKHNYQKRIDAMVEGKKTLLNYLIQNHGGMSAAKRLVDAGAVSINGRVAHLVELNMLLLNPGDVVQIGKHWNTVIVDESGENLNG